MAHWINITGRTKGHKFQCSECKGKCNCISIGNADKYGARNICDYEYCPRCGKKMDLTQPTTIIEVEKKISELERTE